LGKQAKILLSKVETRNEKRYFIGNGDAGFGAQVAATFDRYRRLGKLGYFIGVVQGIMKIKPLEVYCSVDGKSKIDKALMIMFARSMYYAGGMKISPNSDPFSNSARMIYLRWMQKLKLLIVFPSVYIGAHLKLKDIHESRVRRLEIKTPGLPVDVEGEAAGYTPCTFSITDKYINIV
jgi:diacylglycerol kinase family enzyme